jgi:hypothetical protein
MIRRFEKSGDEENGHYGLWVVAPEKEGNGGKL